MDVWVLEVFDYGEMAVVEPHETRLEGKGALTNLCV